MDSHADNNGPGRGSTPLGPGSGGPLQAPPPIPQLPPQMFTTAASLLDLTDKKLTVILRDARKLLGVLRSWDQFGNLVLSDAVERIFAGGMYADVARGVYLVRGENVMLMGEVDLDKDDIVPPPHVQGDLADVLEAQKREAAQRKKADLRRARRLRQLGFEGETSGEAIL